MGLVGAILLWIGMRHEGEVAGTWYGFWAGTLLWSGWVEFAFVWNANMLGVPDLMDTHAPGEIATKAEYLVMMSSVGVCLAVLVPLMLNRETKCNMFVWIQRNLGHAHRQAQPGLRAELCLHHLPGNDLRHLVLLPRRCCSSTTRTSWATVTR